MSHTPQECTHNWSSWLTEAHKQEDGVAYVLVRRCFGVAGAGHRPLGRWSWRVAWPSGDWGSLPVEGGLEVAFKRALAESPDAAAMAQLSCASGRWLLPTARSLPTAGPLATGSSDVFKRLPG